MIEVKNHITPAIYRRFCWFGVRYHNRKINRIVFVLCLLYLILGVFSTDISSLIQAIVTDIIVAALMLSIYIVSISRMVKNFPQNNPMAADAIDIFSFDDERINIETSGELQNGTIEFSYDIFFNVYETKDSFYLYNSNLTAYLLPKSDFTQGTPEELRQLFQTKLGTDKFKIYH